MYSIEPGELSGKDREPLTRLFDPIGGKSTLYHNNPEIENAFKEFVVGENHPCLAAQSVLNNDGLQMAEFQELGTRASALALAQRLSEFVRELPTVEARFTSFVAVFQKPVQLTELKFEQLLWKQLNLLHTFDEQEWDKGVSQDPENPAFSFSFAGKAFFVIGLHPGSSRKARQFFRPALVFNLHSQFEELKSSAQFEKMRDMIRARDEELQGSINPMVEDHGKESEAKQYSGRRVAGSWKCPFLNQQL